MDWMKKELMTGFQKLLCLSMDRTPAQDLIMGTVEAWLEALTFNKIWDQERDTQRIQEAFRTVVRTKKYWPAPVEFIECLPAITERPALPAKTFTDAERLSNLDNLAEMAKDVLQ